MSILTTVTLVVFFTVFGDSFSNDAQDITPASAMAVLQLLNGFLLTVTYTGIVVAVSPNVQQFLGYSEVGSYLPIAFNHLAVLNNTTFFLLMLV